ncbi:hypothetical protein [Peptostreptococcus equinus]|uniref:Phage protein n=1 Tax=Peptostreptococcus equinus TaxID=3003601 RepID=A0ABY7JQ85_9FIRM|nr:hypothetical protein [Peptostreptococcus sp. CBA3647]WAW15275.1 hypothetical protein O0R46_02150 [Peptostreptococcus sp. CBA3647]
MRDVLFTKEELQEVERWLKGYKYLSSDIRQYDLKIESVKRQTYSSGAIRYDKDKLSPSYAFNSEVENEVLRKEKEIERLERLKQETLLIKERIEIAINNLTSDQKILFDYEFNNKERRYKKQQIADFMQIDIKTLNRLHDDLILSSANSLHPERTREFLYKNFNVSNS